MDQDFEKDSEGWPRRYYEVGWLVGWLVDMQISALYIIYNIPFVMDRLPEGANCQAIARVAAQDYCNCWGLLR